MGMAHGRELSFQWMPQARIEYEGTGYREVPNGWELKVKPWTPAGGVRWRTDPVPGWGVQAQYWMNRPSYAYEIGNSAGDSANQTGQTELSLQSMWVDLRRPLARSSVEVVFGVNGAYQSFRRKDVVFLGSSEPGTVHEKQTALGGHIGFHGYGMAQKMDWRPALFWDGELLLGHYFWTRNALDTEGGGIHRGGYSYLFRLEGGVAWPRWRCSFGYTRQLYEILVPGGRRFTPGQESSATASLPINKTDLFGFFLALTRTY